MKDFNELTKEELYFLTNEAIDKYKKLVLAEKGIEFPKKPKAPEPIEAVEDKEVYCIDGLSDKWGEVCFEDIEEAREFLAVVLKMKTIGYRRYKSNVDYNTYFFEKGLPRDYYDRQPNLSIRVERVFTKDKFEKLEKSIIKFRADRDLYDAELKEYEKTVAKVHVATDFIDDKVKEAREDIERKKYLTDIMVNEYMPLADGNVDMAMKFLDKTYHLTDEQKEYVIAHVND